MEKNWGDTPSATLNNKMLSFLLQAGRKVVTYETKLFSKEIYD